MKSILIAAISTATIFLSCSATVVVGFVFQSVVGGQQQRSSFSPTPMRTSKFAMLSNTTTLASTTTNPNQQQSLFDNFDYNSHWYPVVWSQDVPLNQPIRVTVSRYAARATLDFFANFRCIFILTCLLLFIILFSPPTAI